MLETPHVVLGVAIATKIGNPWLAIPLAFASHFVLDKVPHWNPHTYTETVKNGGPSRSTITIAVVDGLVSLATGLGFAYSALPNRGLALTIIACCLASVLPDVSKYPFFLFKNVRHGIYKKWVDYERSMQVQVNSIFWGLSSQALLILACFWWLRT
jgi:hypothetical protein